MSKFFRIEDNFFNLNQVVNVKFDEVKFTITFESTKEAFTKCCENKKEFENYRDVVLAHLDIVDLGMANKPKMATNINISY